MPSYLIETYLARGHAGERTACEDRARSAAEELTRAGTDVSFDGVIHIPEDETCFFMFGAPSGDEAVLVARLAALDPVRVVEAVASREE
jgi:beta-glucosidase-like glycosyl hydrolase